MAEAPAALEAESPNPRARQISSDMAASWQKRLRRSKPKAPIRAQGK
jgi:hypothetical protein